MKSAAWVDSLFRDFGSACACSPSTGSRASPPIASLALAMGRARLLFAHRRAHVSPAPGCDPHQLFDLAHIFPPFMSPNNQPREFDQFSYPQFTLLRDVVRDSADLFITAYNGGLQPAVFDGAGGLSENVRAGYMDGRGFEILGVKPASGRLIQPDDDSSVNGHLVAVISYPFWKRRFGGSPTVLGRKVTLFRNTFEIIGVTSPSFTGLQPGYLTDVWVPPTQAADPRLLAQDVELAAVWGRVHPDIQKSRLREPLPAAFTDALRERLRINPPRNLRGDQLKPFAGQPLIIRDASRGGGRDSLFRVQFRRPFQILRAHLRAPALARLFQCHQSSADPGIGATLKWPSEPRSAQHARA